MNFIVNFEKNDVKEIKTMIFKGFRDVIALAANFINAT